MSNKLNADKYAEAIRTSGRRAIANLHRSGIPAYFMDSTICDGIIKEYPDGSRQMVEVGEGEDVVIENLPPAP